MLSKGSGQRIALEGREHALPGDLIAIAPMDSGLPHLLVECGGVGKRLGVAFRELRREPLPGGFVALLARVVARKWWYYIAEGERFSDLREALDGLRAS